MKNNRAESNFTEILARFQSLSEGTPESVSEMIELYLKTMSDQILELTKALEFRDTANAERLSHSAVGFNDMVGVFSTSSLFRELEKEAHANRFEDAGRIFGKIREEFEHLRGRLREYAERLKSS
jgi:HPt (histidine-containing phosphotransfer) domain-containing protein